MQLANITFYIKRYLLVVNVRCFPHFPKIIIIIACILLQYNSDQVARIHRRDQFGTESWDYWKIHVPQISTKHPTESSVNIRCNARDFLDRSRSTWRVKQRRTGALKDPENGAERNVHWGRKRETRKTRKTRKAREVRQSRRCYRGDEMVHVVPSHSPHRPGVGNWGLRGWRSRHPPATPLDAGLRIGSTKGDNGRRRAEGPHRTWR